MAASHRCSNPECGKPRIKASQARCFCGGEWMEVAEPSNGPNIFQVDETEVILLKEADDLEHHRHTTGFEEFDRVLGGGLAETQVVLLAGKGGAGKTTLVHQTLAGMIERGVGVLYASGEESQMAAKRRGERLGGRATEIPFMATTDIVRTLQEAARREVQVLFIDSMNVMRDPSVSGLPGHPSQMGAVVNQVTSFAISRGVGVILNAHATRKEDIAAVERIIHLVDTPLYLNRLDGVRVLRCRGKNRFGTELEIGYFEMTEGGLVEVSNPSRLFLGTQDGPTIGGATGGFTDGTRAILVEVQALVTTTSYPSPQRVAVGIPPKRLAMLLAILERHGKIGFQDQDVFVNLTGGLKVTEPALDAAILIALVSSRSDRPVEEGTLILGEVALDGTARTPRGVDRVVPEAARLGYKKVYLPKSVHLDHVPEGLEIQRYGTIRELLGSVVGRGEDETRRKTGEGSVTIRRVTPEVPVGPAAAPER